MLTNKNQKRVIALFSLFLCATISYSATVSLDNYWNGSAGNLAAAFTQAENAAGNGGTINLSAKTYNTSKTITIKKTITIQGAGKTGTVVKATSSINSGLFQIDANNVSIKALTVNCNGLAKHGIRTGKNNIASASKNLKCINIKVLNHTSQGLFSGHGNALNGLYVDGCDFHSNYDNAYPHIFISNRNWKVRPMNSIDPFTIKNSTFSGRGEGGLHAANSIEFDGGNDDVNIVTDLKGSLVTGCTFEKTAKWQISWVECINVSVTNCVFKGTLGVQSFAQPIHLEQFCKNIRIEGNRIHQNNSNSDHIWAGGSDYGTPVAGPSNCIIRNNIFTGTARHGYFDGISTSANGNLIEDNDFSGATFSNDAVKIKGSNNKVRCNKGLTASKVNLYGGSNNTFTPWNSSCGGPIGTNSIAFVNTPTSIATGANLVVSVSYESAAQNDVVAVVTGPTGTWLANDVETVSAGTGTKTLTISQGTGWTVANGYQLAIAIRPVGSDMGSAYDTKTTTFNVTGSQSQCNLPYANSGLSISNETKTWNSPVYNISCASEVSLSMDLEGVGSMETSDYLNVYYKVDGGAQQDFSLNTDDFSKKTVAKGGIGGNTLQIVVEGKTSVAAETYHATNINIVEDQVAQHLVLNPGFETGDINSWAGFGTREALTDANNGVYGVKVTGSGSLVQVINGLTPNTSYVLSAYTKVGNGTALLGVKEFGGTEKNVSVSSTAFELNEITFTTGSGNSSAKIYYYVPNSGNIGFADDFSVVKSLKSGRDVPVITAIANAFVYPNPSSGDFINIDLTGFDSSVNVNIYDLQGKVLNSVANFNSFEQLSIGKLEAGSYLIKVYDSHNSVIKQFIKQ